ncbi:hypothetical protein CLHOM_30310 [Clostridium homopropionicum DSM 5847]|uniref:Penicillinase repressor n=1 Tax=Clostridium homopropionicum DSM 5847 TaxID=1121318 RepID=A0A0L6Z709_9CLOT|nr:hypothetical protein [Clostridium homopropionicum]KOA18747.1 hypothetical protein CLHOM_30310 [Clostridium homopropionicum DSM 5847]SFG54671.1 hypothetical protein SAMN04488501_110168 [Clostridium homopropionicum]
MNNNATLADKIWDILKLEKREMTIKEIKNMIPDKPESTIRGRLRDKMNALNIQLMTSKKKPEY